MGLNQPFCEEVKTKSKYDSKTKKDGKVEKHVRISAFTKLAGLRTMMNHNMMVMMMVVVVMMMMNRNMMVMMVVVMVIMMNHNMMAIISNVFRYCYGLLLLSSFCHMSNYINTSFVFSLVSLPITVVVIPYCIAFNRCFIGMVPFLNFIIIMINVARPCYCFVITANLVALL